MRSFLRSLSVLLLLAASPLTSASTLPLPSTSTSTSTSPPSTPRGATVWVYSCATDPKTWGNIWASISSAPTIDTVSLCAYRVEANGSFGLQGGCGATMAAMIPVYKAARPDLKQVPLIDAPSVDNLREMWQDPGRRARFIAAAIDELVKQKLDGFNLDWEVQSKDNRDTDNFVAFLREFGAAIRKAKPGATLSSDVAGSLTLGDCTCDHCDYLNMSCANYTSSRVDNVVTMGTYTHNATDFCRAVVDSSKTSLAPVYTPGLSLSTPDDVIGAFFDCVTTSKADRIFLWALDGKTAQLSQAWNSSLLQWQKAGAVSTEDDKVAVVAVDKQQQRRPYPQCWSPHGPGTDYADANITTVPAAKGADCCEACWQHNLKGAAGGNCSIGVWHNYGGGTCSLKASMKKPFKGHLVEGFVPQGPPPGPPKAGFRFASHYSSHMVLQGAPQTAMLWGFTTSASDEVAVKDENGTTFAAKVAPAPPGNNPGQWIWSVTLNPVHASFAAHSFTATSKAGGGSSVTIDDVLFGDVYVCSGQSNMVRRLSQEVWRLESVGLVVLETMAARVYCQEAC